ncbi:MAG: hypothetical protein ABIR91_03515 [Candidatus Saccharimonadales bacterium]
MSIDAQMENSITQADEASIAAESETPSLDGITAHQNSRSAALDRVRNAENAKNALEAHFTADAALQHSHTPAGGVLAPLSRMGNQVLNTIPWMRTAPDALVRYSMQGQYNTYLYLLGMRINERIRECGRSISVAVVATGGGTGKTAISANVAVQIAHAAQVAAIIVETNENDGTLHFKMGIDRDEYPLLPDAVKDPSLVRSGASIASTFGKHAQTTTYAILSHALNSESKFSLSQLIAFSTEVEKHVGVVVYDTGNGLGRNEVATLKADVLLVAIYAKDTTKYSAAFSTLANLYSIGHTEKVTKHSRIVITGVDAGDTLDDHRDRILEAVIIARSSIVGDKDKWSKNPLEILHKLGLARVMVDESGEDVHDEGQPRLVLCDEKFDLVAYNDYVNTPKPASVLPEETGLETSVGFLKVAYNAMSMAFPSPEFKLDEEHRRAKETQEEDQRPMIDASSPEAVLEAIRGMSPAELQAILTGASRAKALAENVSKPTPPKKPSQE